jgi:uncharacterized protein DUF3738
VSWKASVVSFEHCGRCSTRCRFPNRSRQLGLKLEQQKRPMPVLVFDHIAEKPIEH